MRSGLATLVQVENCQETTCFADQNPSSDQNNWRGKVAPSWGRKIQLVSPLVQDHDLATWVRLKYREGNSASSLTGHTVLNLTAGALTRWLRGGLANVIFDFNTGIGGDLNRTSQDELAVWEGRILPRRLQHQFLSSQHLRISLALGEKQWE